VDLISYILGSLGFELKVAIFYFINFVLVFVVLKKLVFDNLSKVIQERQDKIQDGINKFQQAEWELQRANNKSQEIIDEAKKQANLIIEQSHKDAATIAIELKQLAEKEIQELKTKAHKQLEIDKESMKNELKDETVKLVLLLTEKLLKQKVNSEIDNKIIAEMINSIDEK
jgi:F-type H+-transporting ATPase subunit b